MTSPTCSPDPRPPPPCCLTLSDRRTHRIRPNPSDPRARITWGRTEAMGSVAAEGESAAGGAPCTGGPARKDCTEWMPRAACGRGIPASSSHGCDGGCGPTAVAGAAERPGNEQPGDRRRRRRRAAREGAHRVVRARECLASGAGGGAAPPPGARSPPAAAGSRPVRAVLGGRLARSAAASHLASTRAHGEPDQRRTDPATRRQTATRGAA